MTSRTRRSLACGLVLIITALPGSLPAMAGYPPASPGAPDFPASTHGVPKFSPAGFCINRHGVTWRLRLDPDAARMEFQSEAFTLTLTLDQPGAGAAHGPVHAPADARCG